MLIGMSDSLRFKRADVSVYVAQKVERRLVCLSNDSWSRLEGVVSPSSAVSWGRKH